MQERIEESNRSRAAADELAHLRNRDRELLAYREQIAVQEKALDQYRTKLKQEQLEREVALQKELEAREKFFKERELKFFEMQRGMEEQLLRSVKRKAGTSGCALKERSLRGKPSLPKTVAAGKASLHGGE